MFTINGHYDRLTVYHQWGLGETVYHQSGAGID